MNKINRRLLSGASFAALALGIPSAASAAGACPAGYVGPGATTIAGTTCTVVGDPATATAVTGSQFGGAGSITLINTSLVVASAFDTAPGAKGTANALGVGIVAWTATDVTAGFINSGTVSAHAVVVNATSTAKAVAVGVSESAFWASTANNFVTNNGFIFATATASAWNGVGGDASATATAIGVKQVAWSADTGNNIVNNNGLIVASANATAWDGTDDAFAHASAIGVKQVATSNITSSANNLVNNAGSIIAIANAEVFSATGTAWAFNVTAIGVSQAASALGAHNAVNNDGLILASANATAFDAGEVWALDTAMGVLQNAKGLTASDVVNNGTGGTIIATANASAWSASTGFAWATARAVAVSQNATAGWTATASLNNDGLIVAAAHAHASSATWADANAFAIGVSQAVVGGSGSANAIVNNGGTIVASANATANWAASGVAWAFANARATGVAQTANAGAGWTASDFFDNSGVLAVSANASAWGATGSASASAVAHGVSQVANGGFAGTDVAINDGLITVAANAFASSAPNVSAFASAYGVHQSATGGSFASASYVNNGALLVNATAVGLGTSVVVATAIAHGVSQFASAGIFANDNVTNGTSGVISVHANATAVGFTASAFAGLSTALSNAVVGVWQSATAGTVAHAFVENDGVIDVGANAFASGFLFAVASAFDVGVAQSALGATGTVTTGLGIFGASVTLVNHGTINVNANALATFGTFAFAFASARGVLQNASAAIGGLFAGAFLTNDGVIEVDATASAIGGAIFGSSATAVANALGVAQTAANGFIVQAQVFNSGTIGPVAHAFAKQWIAASASANATGVLQNAFENSSLSSLASALLINSGNILVTAIATAKAGISGVAAAHALGVSQSAHNADFAIASAVNSGLISVSAYAEAHGGIAFASATAAGLIQFAQATIGAPVALAAIANFTNSGTLNVVASAVAHGGVNIAVASALGVSQSAWAPSGALVVNNHLLNATGALINVSAHALATGGNAAGFTSPAAAHAIGITQSASNTFFTGLLAANTVTNLGTIHVLASAVGVGGEWANVSASALGIGQNAWNAVLATDVIVNGGTISVSANASGSATQDGFGAHAFANAVGVFQLASATNVSGVDAAVFSNSGLLTVHAHAKAASLTWTATAVAVAVGVSQTFGGAFSNVAFATVINSGTMNVQASATANAPLGATAIAQAQGIVGTASTPLFYGLNIVNNGSLHVEADVAGNGFGLALATGIAESGFVVFGTIANNANLTVVADAGAAASGSAFALGIGVGAVGYTALVSNAGSLHVEAITGTGGGFVTAVGILVSGASTHSGGTAVGTVINAGGDIFAGVSMDDGDTFFRGTAINVAFAPNAMNVILSGAGHGTSSGAHIYGNIFISTDDTISVVNGNTCFNGVINQPYVSAVGGPGSTFVAAYPLTAPFLPSLATSAGGIDPFVASAAVGQLTIAASGTLVLANDPKQGAAAAYVSNYTQAGVLVMEIRGTTPNGGQGGDNTVGKIVASVSANLGGTLTIIPFAGLYTDTSYAIVSAPKGGINGTWAAITDPSVLLAFSVSNSGTVAVDQKILNVDRIAFNAVPGLTKNEQQVALGIEKTYSTSLTGPYAQMVANLFQIGSGAQYADALRQLSGVEYGLLVSASHTSVRMLDNTVGTHLQVISSGGTDHVGQLIKGVSPAAGGTGIGKGNVWISAWGNWGDPKAKSSNPSTHTSDQGILVGVDFEMDNQTTLGLVGGESSGRVRFQNDYHNSAEYRGWHLGVYGRYDDDSAPWYIEGLGAYSVYTNDVTRHIFIDPTINTLCCHFGFDEPASIIAGKAHGSFDSHTFSFNAEAGWNWDTGSAIDLTPFIGLTWMDTSSDSFNETGFAGGNLHIADAAAESLATHLGIRLTTDWAITEHMLISPIVRVEWEHEFQDDLWSVQESFAGAPVGGTFRTVGTGYAKDFLNVGAAAAFDISGRVDAVIGYEGHFSSDEHDNAITGRVNLHW